jgi:hypothetical protein
LKEDKSKDLAEEHLIWLKDFLKEAYGIKMSRKSKKIYKDVFVHGYKHGKECSPVVDKVGNKE